MPRREETVDAVPWLEGACLCVPWREGACFGAPRRERVNLHMPGRKEVLLSPCCHKSWCTTDFIASLLLALGVSPQGSLRLSSPEAWRVETPSAHLMQSSSLEYLGALDYALHVAQILDVKMCYSIVLNVISGDGIRMWYSIRLLRLIHMEKPIF